MQFLGQRLHHTILYDCSCQETPLSNLTMSRLSAQFFVNFVNSARLPCAARWGGWVDDCRIELRPMALTQLETVFLFYNVPVAPVQSVY